jgi:hypothetical protein
MQGAGAGHLVGSQRNDPVKGSNSWHQKQPRSRPDTNSSVQVAGLIRVCEPHRKRFNRLDQFLDFIMNKLLIILIGVATMSTTSSAFAGLEQQTVELSGSDQPASQPKLGQSLESTRPGSGRPAKCPPDKLVLQLDHGPRAQSTPYLNRLRKERYEAQVQACAKPAT